MKRSIFCAIMLSFTLQSFCQSLDTANNSVKQKFLIKSRNQRSGAYSLLGLGSALIVGGLLVGNRKESNFGEAGAGFVMGGFGVISAVGSIPLFLASGRNKRRAAAIGYLRFERNPIAMQRGLVPEVYPAVCLRVSYSRIKNPK